jgi:hypothetical protein
MLLQSCFLRLGGLAECSYHHANTGRNTKMAGKLYFDPKHPRGFFTLKLLHDAARGKTAGELRAWHQAKDAYT